jgi:hypothetical protein
MMAIAVRVSMCGGSTAAATMRVGAHSYGRETIVVAQDIRLEDPKLEIENIKEFSLDAAYIPLAKDTCAKCPMYILKCRVIEILRGAKKNQHPHHYAVKYR